MTRPRTLVVDENFPNAGRDAGSVAIVSHIKSLIRLGHETHFLATSRKPVSGPLAERLLADYATHWHGDINEVFRKKAY